MLPVFYLLSFEFEVTIGKCHQEGTQNYSVIDL